MFDECDHREAAAAAVGPPPPLRQIGEGEIPWLLPSPMLLSFTITRWLSLPGGQLTREGGKVAP